CADLLRKDGELLEQDRGLQRIEPPVDADPDVVVLVASLAMYPERPQQCGELPIVGKDGATVAVAAEGLGREKRRRRDLGQGAYLAAVPPGPEALRRVVHDPEAERGCGAADRLVIRRLAEQIDGDDAARREPRLAGGGDARLDSVRVEI